MSSNDGSENRIVGCKNHITPGDKLKRRLHYLLPILIWLGKTTSLQKHHVQNQDLEGTKNIERGIPSETNEQADAPLVQTQSLTSEIQLQVDMISTSKENQMPQDALKESHQFIVIIQRAQIGDANKAQENLDTFQKIGLEVIKIWVLPLSLVLVAILFQVVTTNQGVKPTKTFSLKPYFASLTLTFILGAGVLALSYTKWNFWGKMFIAKLMIVVAFTSSMVNLGLLIVLGWWLA